MLEAKRLKQRDKKRRRSARRTPEERAAVNIKQALYRKSDDG